MSGGVEGWEGPLEGSPGSETQQDTADQSGHRLGTKFGTE